MQSTSVDAAGADRARRGRDDAEHHLREGSAGHVPAGRRRRSSSSRTAPTGTATAVSTSRRIQTASSPRTIRAGGSSPTTATTIPATPATSSRRWRRPRTATARSSSCSRRSSRASIPRGRPRATRAGQRSSRRWTPTSPRRVEDVVRLTPTIVEVIVKAPAAARHFHPGQFYRLQNYETRRAARGERRTRHSAADGRHRAHRRMGRQGEGPAVADRARARRVEPPRARTCARASRWS